jgi:hypothetical protein
MDATIVHRFSFFLLLFIFIVDIFPSVQPRLPLLPLPVLVLLLPLPLVLGTVHRPHSRIS